MVDERAPALARRLAAHGRVLRRGRIFARLREGWAYDEIASQERLTAERVRQIVRQALERRIIDEGAEHAKLQLARLQPAMRLAGEAIADGDVTAIAPLMKALDRLEGKNSGIIPLASVSGSAMPISIGERDANPQTKTPLASRTER